MRVTVFGATGNIGGRVVAEALSRAHDVTAVVRSASRLPTLPRGAAAQIGNANRVDDAIRLSKDQDLVISATRPLPGQEDELVLTAKTLLTGVRQAHVRLFLVGGAGSLTVSGRPDATIIDDPRYVSDAWRKIAQACTEQLEVCRAETEADWVYLSPPASIAPGQRTGRFRLGKDELLVDAQGNSQISFEDLAVAVLDEAEQPRHHRARFTVAY